MLKLVNTARENYKHDRGSKKRPIELRIKDTDKWMDFKSQLEAANYLKSEYPSITTTTLRKAIKSGNPYRGKYFVRYKE